MASRSVGDDWSTGVDSWGNWAVDPATGMRFRLLLEGQYSIGLSDRERRAAEQLAPQPQWSVEEMRPVVSVQIGALWVGELPVSCSIARSAGLSVSGGDSEPALLMADEVDLLCEEYGWRRLLEAEWETCCRGGQGGLFAWGNQLPDGDSLSAWMSWDMTGNWAPKNSWGFGSLFFGEWCEDSFRVGHDRQVEAVEGACVIKGGGAQFWPWQTGQEWVWCASAMRMPSTDLFADRRAAFRPGLVTARTGR